MVCLDMDHPEIVDFISWKVREEKKAQALIAAGYASDFNGEAYHTVSGQNSNNSVRVTDDVHEAPSLTGGEWQTHVAHDRRGRRHATTPATCGSMVAEAAWACADPGVQYDTTINHWHTCPNTGAHQRSNPCSEYMFLDDTACNLASLNLTKFLGDGRHASTSKATATPCASSSWRRRSWSISRRYPTQSDRARTRTTTARSASATPTSARCSCCRASRTTPTRAAPIAGALTAIMCGQAYRVSAEMAATKGPFPGYAKNREPMLRVMRMHRDAAYAIDRDKCPEPLWRAAVRGLGRGRAARQEHGYRNAQATVLAPTGTIGLLMDCDTTGIEPDFALVKFKKLAGGGYFKIVNQSVPEALRRLGYSPSRDAGDRRLRQRARTRCSRAPHVNRASLKARGLNDDELAKVEGGAARRVRSRARVRARGCSARDATSGSASAEDQMQQPGLHPARATSASPTREIDEANDVIIGRMTVEGAPHLRAEHYPVFDCANRCGKTGQRFLAPMSHVRMMAAAQPFLSGAISQDGQPAERGHRRRRARDLQEGWKLGLKAVALYRDGCKASQPLSTTSKEPAAKDDTPTRSSLPPACARASPPRRCRVAASAAHARRSVAAHAAHGDARAPAQEAPRLHPGGHASAGTRCSCAPASTRTAARRDLHRHAQGRRRLPLADELLRDVGVDGPAVRRAARDVRRAVHVHALRAAGRSSRATRTSSSRRRSSTTSSACSASSTCSATTSRRSRPRLPSSEGPTPTMREAPPRSGRRLRSRRCRGAISRIIRRQPPSRTTRFAPVLGTKGR